MRHQRARALAARPEPVKGAPAGPPAAGLRPPLTEPGRPAEGHLPRQSAALPSRARPKEMLGPASGSRRLIDAKGASQLLGVPDTWLLAQARARRIPHHRLGHYVRFDPQDLAAWLRETRIEPHTTTRRER
jgi:excisionase family DNA binding protein